MDDVSAILPSKLSQSLGSPEREGLKKNKTIRQKCSMTQASFGAEVCLFFFNLLVYRFKYVQNTRYVLSGRTCKAVNKIL